MASTVVVFNFDPVLRFGALAVRWETLGIAGAVMLAIVLAGVLARRTPADADGRRLHLDDLLYIVVGVVPGAVVGGRLGYALLHLDYYVAHPGALLDPTQGGLQLSLGIAGGMLTGLYVARVLETPAGRWAHAAALPMLVAIEGGKAAMAWGGRGQGAVGPAPLATAYLGPGPWGSLAPSLPAQPAQLFEAALTAGVAVALVILLAAGFLGARDGRLLLASYAIWLVGRVLVATTWRDPAVLGPLRADQILSIGLLAASLAGLVVVARHRPRVSRAASADGVAWPDPDLARSWRDRLTPGG